ncbi:MAG: beta-phosphoglucomutase family hydrolase [Bacteroidales bacterium]|nr:beta-phosphoglucomutase family hydrolase [Bacteroidales bacterium]
MLPKFHFDAVIFDLDGVITRTALVHSKAWKRMFDEFLKSWTEKNNIEFQAFDHINDYLPYVDGKPRYKGVASFLESRNIELPYGNAEDGTEMETICGLGNRKNEAFNQVLEEQGVEVYPSTIELIYQLRQNGIRVGVASSSRNCEQVLRRAGILNLFETRVDGVVSVELNLNGKPEPDIFTTACRNLGAVPDRAVVVEDAVSGVQAGFKGNFGLVIGIAREENQQELAANGADIVVDDLEGISGINGIEKWFVSGKENDSWEINYHGYFPEKEKSRESILSIGNGYLGVRGALEEAKAGKTNYPGTYMSGVYNRLVSKVGDRDVENEDFVNCLNLFPVNFRIDEGEWISTDNAKIIKLQRTLDLKNGLLCREMIIEKDGQQTQIRSERFISMDDSHLGGQRYHLRAINYSGNIEIRSGIDGHLINAGVERYNQLNQQHLKPVRAEASSLHTYTEVCTVSSGIHIAAYSQIIPDNKENLQLIYESSDDQSWCILKKTLKEGEGFGFDKLISVMNSYSTPGPLPHDFTRNKLSQISSYDSLLERSSAAWSRIWEETHIEISGDRLSQKLLHLHNYHIHLTISAHSKGIDAGIPARGLHGEAYRGHIFWDELYILPLFHIHYPDIARAVHQYRVNRLEEARRYASENNYTGAMYPWQSGSSGREETQVIHLNPISGKWGDDYSCLQRHVSLAVAYNLYQYMHLTADTSFMAGEGAKVYLEICRFWAGKAFLDSKTGRYHIDGVMGPDEFHEKYPGAEKGGLRDNAYTNIMVAWMLQKVDEIRLNAEETAFRSICNEINLKDKELQEWTEIRQKLNLVISKEGIIAQYDGYFDLEDIDWDYFRKKYGNVYRMDRLLKAEGKSPDAFKVAKQADTLMAFYNLGLDECNSIIRSLGYQLPDDYLQKNLAYYLARTSHGSTLSRVVHARLAGMIGQHELGLELYRDALNSDFSDAQGGTTGEGIHAGVMASTIWISINTYAGLDLNGKYPVLNPALPEGWNHMKFSFRYKTSRFFVHILPQKMEVMALNIEQKPSQIAIVDQYFEIESGESVWVDGNFKL